MTMTEALAQAAAQLDNLANRMIAGWSVTPNDLTALAQSLRSVGTADTSVVAQPVVETVAHLEAEVMQLEAEVAAPAPVEVAPVADSHPGYIETPAV